MLQRLRLYAATTFVLSNSGRILRENDPDHSSGPRLFFAGCPQGNLVHVRRDVTKVMAAEVIDLFAAERPWFGVETRPTCLGRVIDSFAGEAPIHTLEVSLIYELPHHVQADADVTYVCSNTELGEDLLATLRRNGVPQYVSDAGFESVADFWPPWCVAMEGGNIASIAFAARISQRAAQIGVYSFTAFRGRGLAAASTAKWSSLASLVGRDLFYTTTVTNTSSQRVAERLGLKHIGMGLHIK